MEKPDGLTLPSNRKFGLFFTFVFAAAIVLIYDGTLDLLDYALVVLSVLTLIVTLINAEWLQPFNKAWMKLGLLIGRVVSPIVLGSIFFVIFTPIAWIFKITGRDELRLKTGVRSSHWIARDPVGPDAGSFKNQF